MTRFDAMVTRLEARALEELPQGEQDAKPATFVREPGAEVKARRGEVQPANRASGT